LAADMVSFWICVSVPFFDLRSAGGATGFPNREPPTLPTPEEDCCCDDAPAVEVADGSEVMRSISVVPDESCPEAMVASEGPREWEISGEQEACLSGGTFRVGSHEAGPGAVSRGTEGDGVDCWIQPPSWILACVCSRPGGTGWTAGIAV
jgi:hypothetical protein